MQVIAMHPFGTLRKAHRRVLQDLHLALTAPCPSPLLNLKVPGVFEGNEPFR